MGLGEVTGRAYPPWVATAATASAVAVAVHVPMVGAGVRQAAGYKVLLLLGGLGLLQVAMGVAHVAQVL